MSDKADLRLPWRIDRDNAEGIEIVAADGDLVAITNHRDIPVETDPKFREQIISRTRARFYFIVESVNNAQKEAAA